MFKVVALVTSILISLPASAGNFLNGLGLAHHRDVKEVSEGVYQITLNDLDKIERQAKHKCGDINGHLVFLDGDPATKIEDAKKPKDADGNYTFKFKCENKKTLMKKE